MSSKKDTQKVVEVPWTSQITKVVDGSLTTYGVAQEDIIRHFSYEEMVFLLLAGRRPTKNEMDLLRAVIVSHASHGITGQSTLAVMQAADCRSEFLHAVIGGFSVGSGKYHQGGLRAAMEELVRYSEMETPQIADDILNRVARKDHIIGFGHRFHHSDPRTAVLMEVAARNGCEGRYIRTAKIIESILLEAKGITMNIEAAGGSILLELAIDPKIAHLIIVVGRSPMYAAVYLERLSQGRAPFQKISVYDSLEENVSDG